MPQSSWPVEKPSSLVNMAGLETATGLAEKSFWSISVPSRRDG
eukprot:CAMPEP_0173436896 /NCGR_PEP_ID=MMETSP1357-20121228/17539_1 /TAXON_ID=77926 /ORGANISM="Hemiselmis rufescens, Strain PCC563" /LENGTH=42 /DNA_ID= /DNA_START= /DNA_END= /DNA_ORIENTATION=